MNVSLLKSLLIFSLISSIFWGCSQKIYVENELKDAPEWVTIPKVKGYIAEVGSATTNSANDFNFQREEAMADARDNLAKQISIKVDNMFKSFKAVTGNGQESTFDKSIEKVSKQISSQTLYGTKINKTWISKSGTFYVLMIIDTNSVERFLEKTFNSSFKNDNALYQRFLASKAHIELKKELEN